MFEQAGITEEPKTWDELTEACKKLTDAAYADLWTIMGDAATTLTSALFASETLTDDPDFDKKSPRGRTDLCGWLDRAFPNVGIRAWWNLDISIAA